MRRPISVLMLAICVCLLLLLGLPAIAFIASPVRQESPSSPWLFVANVADLPTDGQPKRMPVLAPDRDAWARRPDRVVRSVFVRRLPGQDGVLVLESQHHGPLRMPVSYDEQAKVFNSCCWRVRFDLEGRELPESDLPPIGHRMERLPARVVGGQVFVHWETR